MASDVREILMRELSSFHKWPLSATAIKEKSGWADLRLESSYAQSQCFSRMMMSLINL